MILFTDMRSYVLGFGVKVFKKRGDFMLKHKKNYRLLFWFLSGVICAVLGYFLNSMAVSSTLYMACFIAILIFLGIKFSIIK